jgi:hypothetical protein
MRLCLPVVLLGAGLFFTASSLWAPALAQDKGKEKAVRAAAKWEYKVIRSEYDPKKIENALNKVGEEGWECFGTIGPHPLGGFGGTPVDLICKRSKQ